MIWKENSLFFEHPDIYGISFDSRFVKKGDLFIALSGSSFDGHDFVHEALQKGACCALVERKICADNIVVDSCLDSFVKIAKIRRSLFRNKVIAITGSVGKSTLKNSLVKSLSSSFVIDSPIKNYNTLIGLSFFFSQFNLDSDYLVVELGISDVGEMSLLANLVLPDLSILTTIASAHSYSLGSLYEILKEKSIIFNFTNDCAFFCKDLWYSSYLFQLMDSLSLKHSNFQFNHDSRLYMHNIGESIFSYLGVKSNFNIHEVQGRRDVFSFSLNNNVFTVIDSSYNANIASMIAELKFFDTYSSNKKVAILGDMFGYNVRYHEFLSLYCNNFECWLIGENMFHLSLTLKNSKFFNSIDHLINYLRSYLVHSNCNTDFLVKGSNSMHLYNVIDFFKLF